jgi:hypothetical protein
MSCPHGNPIGDCDICDEIDAAFKAGRQSALAEQPAPAQFFGLEIVTDETMPTDELRLVQSAPVQPPWMATHPDQLPPAPPAQEPVAWLFQHEETGLTECVDAQQVEWGFEKNNPRWQKVAPLYTTPPAPAQEPDPDELTIAYMSGVHEGKKRKPWVGLTNEERRHLRKCNQQHDALALAVEALLKEKNT